MAEIVSGRDFFEELVAFELASLKFVDPTDAISEHLNDDWSEAEIDLDRPRYNFSFRSSEGSTLKGSDSPENEDGSGSTTVDFKSSDGDTLKYTSTLTNRETETSFSQKGADMVTLSSGKGTRDTADDIAFSLKGSYTATENDRGSSLSGSGQVSYTDGLGTRFSIKTSFSAKENESSSSGKGSVTISYIDQSGNRVELNGKLTYSFSETSERYSLDITRLLLIEEGETLIDVSRVRVTEPPDDLGLDVFDLEQLLGGDEESGEILENTEAVYVTLAGLVETLAEVAAI